ncbi:MAG TPA: hypothetical protein VK420_22255, partial [Longimicrobium sp.]|nr:hypothetical protein [Longimicrobium sp.]
MAPAFLAHAKGRFAEPTDVTALEALLGRTVEDARAQWPGVMLPAEAFLRHLAERLPESSPPAPLEALL